MHSALCPSLYQINTRVWLTELSHSLGRPATLDDIPNAELDRFATMGFDWVCFLSVWQTGPAGQRVSRTNAEWRREFEETLPDLREEDIAGSGFAITAYRVHDLLGGDAALHACHLRSTPYVVRVVGGEFGGSCGDQRSPMRRLIRGRSAECTSASDFTRRFRGADFS